MDQTDLDERAELSLARANLYKLLAEAYRRPPGMEFLETLRDWAASLVTQTEYLDSLSPEMKDSLVEIDRFFQESRADPPVEELSVEFTRLFRGVKQATSPPPPYESVYREGAAHVYGSATVAVRQEYSRYGLEPVAELGGEPPDHISFELEFMHCLCRRAADSWQRGDEEESERLLLAQKEFLESHLMAWVPKLCEVVRREETLGLYRGLAGLTESWVAFDCRQHLKDCAG
ncbi:MAG: molecular chaperone TorD family protein [Chloroflexi bacterium]|nr:molecular chaperone TorD family protein [Chloroflexota bacterium]